MNTFGRNVVVMIRFINGYVTNTPGERIRASLFARRSMPTKNAP